MRVTSGQRLGAEAWDRIVLAQSDGNLLQSWAWGELQARFGWAVERICFEDGAAGVCSLQRSRSRLAGRSEYYVPHGPVVPAWAREAVVSELVGRARREAGMVLRIEPKAPAGDPWPDLLASRGFRPEQPVQPLVTRLLDLTIDPDTLRASFKPKTRYNLGLAERKGVAVSTSENVGLFAELCATTARRQGIRLPQADYYRHLLEIFRPTDGARLYLAHHDARLLAGILVVRFGTTAHYLFGGSADDGRELMPNYLLHWTAMLEFRGLGCTTYDWWGIAKDPSPENPWFGLYRFKTGFGGKTVRYVGLYELPLRPRAWQWEMRLRKWKRRVRSLYTR